MKTNDVNKEKCKSNNENIPRNVGIAQLKGKIEGIELKCDIELTFKDAVKNKSDISKLPRKITQWQMCFYFYLPFLALLIAIIFDLIFDSNFHLILFLIPIIFGIILNTMVVKSGTVDLDYFKKFVDTITFASSGLTACILIFKTIDSENPYIGKIYALHDGNLISQFFFAVIFTLVYSIITTFAISAVLKFLISLRDLKNYKEK
ncbi:hypothetical protein ABF61_04750 [Enterobacter hormaechei subsp. steigerwaltii]|uniref:hypothetical protein n=1 Tax=Enterobacter hormaechei TaxID=158836 RepID=UPI00064A182F|nr:hypothetical protein [Enterobacter hormaechei]KLR00324.1 hypothetical protein ABF61_04750 [Enterobacter hormaechei subsp. steigerwaltii]